jgi:hypothetical protein
MSSSWVGSLMIFFIMTGSSEWIFRELIEDRMRNDILQRPLYDDLSIELIIVYMSKNKSYNCGMHSPGRRPRSIYIISLSLLIFISMNFYPLMKNL